MNKKITKETNNIKKLQKGKFNNRLSKAVKDADKIEKDCNRKGYKNRNDLIQSLEK